MRAVVTLEAAGDPPARATVLRSQGIPEGTRVPRRIRDLVSAALDKYSRLSEPRGMLAEISRERFGPVYRGEGNNARRTPLVAIYPRADHLALFAVTLGEGLSREIRRLFDTNEPALASMLDAVASERGAWARALRSFARRLRPRRCSAARVQPSLRQLARGRPALPADSRTRSC